MASLHHAAVAYASHGRAVFPLKPRGKTPLTQHGLNDATKDAIQISAWWQQWPEANIGCATGQASGFWSLDIDGDEGEASLRSLEAQHGELPRTVEIITGRGRQAFFKYETPIRNSAGRLGTGLDVRGDGGYTILPPSIHPTGKRYEWSVDGYPGEVSLASSPEWLIAAIDTPGKDRTANGSSVDWPRLIAGEVPEGQRNDSVARIAGLLLRKLDTPDGPFVALNLVRAWNLAHCKPPLPDDEIARTIESIAAIEIRRRTE
ncbi:MAG: bifunctional DNA primase/polymerase [Proteobacteria bacterium]|nr:bifunctional DNA primase/polymerase [Pseudomonadota bacterium]